jgi:hypothetical protein
VDLVSVNCVTDTEGLTIFEHKKGADEMPKHRLTNRSSAGEIATPA